MRRSLKRSDDPTGTTVPATFSLNSPDDFAELLPARPPRFAPGQALPGKPGWVLVEPLGVGGFGEVWLARHSRMASLTGAVKFCHGEAARDLQHESTLIDRVMAAGKHPNIVALLDVNLDGDTPWVMFEYVQGGDLSDMIREWQSLPREQRLERALTAVGQLAEAVGHFHRLSPAVIHRDLKPSNILRDRATGALRITDFGIGAVAAKVALGDQTGSATARGGRLLSYLRGSHTPLYSSPQQRAGADPDPRDDVHAIGVIAYQMLTGDLTNGVGTDFGDDLRDAGTPDGLVALIGACVAQKPERRPADGVELRERLQHLRTAKPTVVADTRQAEDASVEKRPGVLAAIVKALEGASEEHLITKDEVLTVLKKQFPERDANGMRATVNAQMPSQLRSERRIVLASRPTESGTGYWIDAEATDELQAGGTSTSSEGRDVFGAKSGTRTHAIHAVLFAATEPLTVKEIAERSKTNATAEHLRTMLQKKRVKKTGDGKYYLASRDEPVEAELVEAEPIGDAQGDDNPGVIASIVEFLRGATEAAPVTKAEILTRLVARFPDRTAEAMKKTIGCQLPSRLRSEKGLDVRQNERGFWIAPNGS